MGKKGDALRAAKLKNVTRTFTEEQLRAHDKLVIETFRERIVKEAVAEANERVEELNALDWERRELAFMENHPIDNVLSCMSLLLATTARVLIERFGWKPIPPDGHYDRRNRTMRFADYVVDELDKITQDENADIRRYCAETYDLYGVKFEVREV